MSPLEKEGHTMPHPTPQGETISAHDRGEDLSTDKTERAAFEAWKATRPYGDDGEWNAWQARASLPSQPATVVQPVADPSTISDPLDALRWGSNVAETLLSIGDAIGFGRAQQILGEQWDAKHGCAPRGRMGVTAPLPVHPSAPAESGWQRRPELAVWFGSMPESNGKRNWTVILYRKEDPDGITSGIAIERTEYYDRARYEADRMRFLIGESETEPSILDYDGELNAAPSAAQPGGADGGEG